MPYVRYRERKPRPKMKPGDLARYVKARREIEARDHARKLAQEEAGRHSVGNPAGGENPEE